VVNPSRDQILQRCVPLGQLIEWLNCTAVCPFGSAHRKAKLYSGVSLWMSGQPIVRLNFTAVCPFGSAHRKAKFYSGVSLWVSPSRG